MDPLASRFVVFKNKSTGKNDTGLSYDLQYGIFYKQIAGEIIKPIDISDNWNIKFNPEMGGPESYQLEKLISWTDIDHEGINYYSGSASYSRDFSIGEEKLSNMTEAFVVFGDIQEMARISVNGNDCGIVWLPPYKAKITPYIKAGTNTITVQVRNPDKEPFTNTNAKIRFNENSPLLKSGLMDKAEIFFNHK